MAIRILLAVSFVAFVIGFLGRVFTTDEGSSTITTLTLLWLGGFIGLCLGLSCFHRSRR